MKKHQRYRSYNNKKRVNQGSRGILKRCKTRRSFIKTSKISTRKVRFGNVKIIYI